MVYSVLLLGRVQASLSERCRISELIPAEDVARVMSAVGALPDVLSQYAYLADLRNSKGGLFFAALEQYPQILLPIVYTPGVGDACLNWGRLVSKPRGLVLTLSDKGNIAKRLKAFKSDASAVVVTDGTPFTFFHATRCRKPHSSSV